LPISTVFGFAALADFRAVFEAFFFAAFSSLVNTFLGAALDCVALLPPADLALGLALVADADVAAAAGFFVLVAVH